MDRPEIILAPGPTPIPPEVLLAQGSPLVYHRGPGFGNLMRDVTTRLKELYKTDSADVLLMTSSGTGGLESAIANCFSPGDEVLVPARRVLLRAVQEARRDLRAHRAYGRVRVGHEDPPRRRRGRAGRASREGRAAHPVRDLHRRDPADRAAREGRQRRRRAGDRRRGVLARRRAVRVRRLGHRRRGGRQPEGPERLARHRVLRDQRARVGSLALRDEPALLLRLGHLQAVRRPAAPREPVDARDQRDAGPAGRADAVLPGRDRGGDGSPPDAVARGEGRREGARPGPVRRRARGQLDRHRDPRAREHRRRHDQRHDPRRSRVRAGAGAGTAEGQGLPHRALRILQRARHHPGARGAGDDLGVARSPREARRCGGGRRDASSWSRAPREGPRHRAALRARAGAAPQGLPGGRAHRPRRGRPRDRDRALRRAHHPQRHAGHRRGARRRASS